MKEKMRIYSDNEGDVLEVDIGKPTPGYCKNLGKDLFEKVDERTGKTKGFTIINFRKRTEKLKSFDLSLPLQLEASS